MHTTFARTLCVALALVLLATATLASDESLETLLAYLKSPNVSTRRDAARKLGERRERNQLAVEALAVSARKDDDRDVRLEAVVALGKLKDFTALADMLGALKDPSDPVRHAAIKALVMLYTEHDIDFITNRRDGWNWFNPFLDTSDHAIIEPYIFVQPEIIQALGETARGDAVRDVRVSAIRALGVLRGAVAVAQLADALNADPDVRIDVIRAFIKIGDPAAGRYLIPFFRDSNQKVRTQAMVAAGLLKYRPAVEPLLAVYGLGPEKSGTMARVMHKVKGRFSYLPPRDEAALWALSLIGDDRAEQTFVENMTDKDSDRRQYAFEGLARLGEARYLDQISRLVLTEGNNDVKLAEYFALYKMGSRPNIQNIIRKLDTDQQDQARAYLMEARPADLFPHIRSSNRIVRQQVIDILGRIGDADTVKELQPIAQTSGAETAEIAHLAIRRIEWRLSGRPRVHDPAMRRTADPDAPRPRRAANP
jgi:HEAT repeat protein